jgi:Undecaprenyl-phosphate galactose phosphotransferase WbaP
MPIAANKRRLINQSSLSLILIDLCSFSFSYALAIFIRTVLNPYFKIPLEPFEGYWLLILLNILAMFLIFALMGLYRGYGTVAVVELRNLTLSLLIAYVILAFSAYLIGQGSHLSRITFILSLLFNLIFVPLFRFIVYNRFSKYKSWGIRVVVTASRDEFANIIERLHRIPRLGFNPEIILCTDPLSDEKQKFRGIPVYPFSPENCQIIKANGINVAFYASKNLSDKDPFLSEICEVFPTIYYVLPESNLSSLWAEVTDLSGRPAIKVSYHLLESLPNFIKRTTEVFCVSLVLLLTLPVTLIIGLLIFIEDKGPVFYTQDRLGLNGKHFKVLKFRTMMVNAESVLEKYLSDNPVARMEYQKFHKLENDPRVTKIGSFLRKFSLDEIPQFLNVIRGDMNLVGPRAYMVNELDVNDEATKTILRVRPGVTGWWQVTGRNEATFSDRQKLDLYYIANWSLWVDYYILIKTIWIILSGKGK